MDGKSTLTNLIWRFMERMGSQGVSLVVSIILARLLPTEAYGTIALIIVFTTILQVFINSGLGTALVQKKDADDLDFSSVFFFNVSMCIVLYILLFFAAPLIAAFYELPELTALVRVLGLTLVISGVNNIQQSYVSKTMQFKRFFFSTLGGTVISAVAGITMAYLGYGVWALVAQNLINNAAATVILWFTIKWHPKRMFSFDRLKGLFSYGWKLLVSNLLDTLYKEVRQLIIGKLYSTNDLAFYNKGSQYPSLIVTNINSSIDSVLLPTMSAEQNDRGRVKAMTRRAIKTSTYIMMPMMVGLAVCAESFIRLLLTEKWLPCVFFLRIFCFTYAFYPIHTANLNAIKAMGRSDMFLKLEIIKKTYGLILLVATMWISVKAMAYSLLLSTVFSQIVNAFPNKKLLGYGYLDQLKDMLPQITLSCVMGIIVYCVNFLNIHDILTIIIQISLGVTIYVYGSILFKLESFEYMLTLLKSYLKKEKGKQ